MDEFPDGLAEVSCEEVRWHLWACCDHKEAPSVHDWECPCWGMDNRQETMAEHPQEWWEYLRRDLHDAQAALGVAQARYSLAGITRDEERCQGMRNAILLMIDRLKDDAS